MPDRILVAYSSKHGATAEIAQRIGQVLGDAGHAVDVADVRAVRDLTPYRAVVLGSGVYIGMWRRPAARFLKRQQEELAQRAVWLYSSGPTGEGDPQTLTQGWTFPKGLAPVAEAIGARSTALFHGAVDPAKLNVLGRWMLKNVDSPVGDYRDWEAIEGWARGIAEALG